MPVFIYSAAKSTGEIVRGEREATNEKALGIALRKEGLFLINASQRDASGGTVAPKKFNIDLKEHFSRLRPIRLTEKMFFARNLSVMISAGLSLNRALMALTEQTKNSKFKSIIEDLNRSITKGNSFAESLRPYKDIFGEIFINMVAVGETTGRLAQILKLLANQMKKEHTLKRRVRGAMIYPAIIITVLILVGALMMIYVVPNLAQTIKELGVPLPLTTQIVISISEFMTRFYLWVLGGIILGILLFWRSLKTKLGKEIFDRISLKFPIFGPLLHKYNVARFCRTLAYLISSGIPIVSSLETTSTVLGNVFYKRVTVKASQEIQKGRQLNEILKEHPKLFEPMVIQMIQVGEETGKISEMLLRTALFFEEEVTNTTKNLSSVIEPLLMVIVGIAVGFFAISMFQPIYGSLGSI